MYDFSTLLAQNQPQLLNRNMELNFGLEMLLRQFVSLEQFEYFYLFYHACTL